MTAPTREQSRGYDIVIWVEDNGHVLAKSHTILGEVAFHGLLPDHKMGQTVQIDDVVDPEKFFKAMPKGIRIGLQAEDGHAIYPTTGLATLN